MTEWEKLYEAAILESDWSKIEEHIEAADSAISARLQEFALNQGGTPEEHEQIKAALGGLSVLRRDMRTWRARAAV
jgi:hypothetical protein